MLAATQPSTATQARDQQTPTLEINEFAIRLIRRKAKELVRQRLFNSSEREDLEQELSLFLLQRLPKFDPQVAHYNVFAKTVIERCVASIIHHRKAKRRSCCRNGGSLNSIIHDSEGNKVELQAILVDDQNKSHTGQDAASEEERLGLGHDLVEVIADLPPRLREICERLKYYSTARVARNMDIRRDEIYELIGRIRQRFAKSDLHNYL